MSRFIIRSDETRQNPTHEGPLSHYSAPGIAHKLKVVSSMIMPAGKSDRFGLVGTITNDLITTAASRVFRGLGGILYQAAVLCGLGKDVFLHTRVGRDLSPEVKKVTDKWPTCHTRGIQTVSGPGNSVILHYPEKGERVEILESLVPPLQPRPVIADLPHLGMLILVINSGFDIELGDWRRIVRRAECPIWFDVHSLALSLDLHTPRHYRPLPEWKEWADGVDYLQANLKEVASMLGDPNTRPSREKLRYFGRAAFEKGVKTVFITLGKEGVLVLTPEGSKKMDVAGVRRVVDTTGCGDVFCAGTAVKLASGANPLEAAAFSLELASEASQVSGVSETNAMVRRFRV
jgi:adenosine kinase